MRLQNMYCLGFTPEIHNFLPVNLHFYVSDRLIDIKQTNY